LSIQDYIRIVRRRGWIVILAAVLTAASAFVFSQFQTPVYRASIDVLIELARPDFGLTQSAKQLLRSYANRMWSQKEAQIIIDELELYVSAAELRGDVKIVADDSLLVIKIDVDDNDGEQAKLIANAWAQRLVEWRDAANTRLNKEDRVFAEVIDPATTYRQIRPKTMINVAAGGIFGLVLGAVVVFVLEWLEAGIVYDPRELEHETGLTVIGVIPPASAVKK
jgi:capsular polysaccharide biosynthesis protein